MISVFIFEISWAVHELDRKLSICISSNYFVINSFTIPSRWKVKSFAQILNNLYQFFSGNYFVNVSRSKTPELQSYKNAVFKQEYKQATVFVTNEQWREDGELLHIFF